MAPVSLGASRIVVALWPEVFFSAAMTSLLPLFFFFFFFFSAVVGTPERSSTIVARRRAAAGAALAEKQRPAERAVEHDENRTRPPTVLNRAAGCACSENHCPGIAVPYQLPDTDYAAALATMIPPASC